MSKHPLYDAAVDEVRGQATQEQKAQLQADVFAWREALQSVLDEVDAQLEVKRDEFEDLVYDVDPDSREYQEAAEAYETWKARVRTFKRHITGRFLAVRRMCQDATERADPALTSALTVVEAAKALLKADEEGTDDEFFDALSRLGDAVESFCGDA